MASTSTMSMTTATTGSEPMMMMNPYADPANCGLAQVAFCDMFDAPSPGGRAGDLDDSKWSFARLNQSVNIGQGSVNTIYPTDAMFCQTPISGVLPPKDSFFCDGTNGTDTTLRGTEHMHWMTAMNDGGEYGVMGARIRQPFDFAGRTGTISFGVDAVTRGSHEWWPQVVIADQPIPVPDNEHPATDSAPRNGVIIAFDNACPTADQARDAPATGPDVQVVRDFQEHELGLSTNPQCVNTMRDNANRFQLKLSQDSLQVWGTDDGSDQFKLLASYSGLALPFTRGYVSFEQVQYNAEKGGGEAAHTYHWHAIGFDGPVLPTPRAYEVPDPTTPGGGGINDGWYVNAQGMQVCCVGAGWPWQVVPSLTVPGVDLSGASQVVLSFDARGAAPSQPISYSLNGGDWIAVPAPPVAEPGAWMGFSVAVPLAALVQGDNTLRFRAASDVALANPELEVETDGTMVTGLDPTTDSGVAAGAGGPAATPTNTPNAHSTATHTSGPSGTPTDTAMSASATGETFNATVRAPGAGGGRSVPVSCTWVPDDSSTVQCRGS